MKISTIAAENHFQRLGRWIDMESAAEARRMAERRKRSSRADVERRGEILLDLVVDDHTIGLGGRYLITLAKRDAPLPWNRLRTGSPVVLSSADEGDAALQGVVSDRTTRTIQVAFDDWPEGDLFRLDLSPDEVTRQRQRAALQMAEVSRGRLGDMRRVLLGDREPRFGEPSELTFFAGLNPSQQEAVRFALSAEDLAIIHGPPGTGKTTTVVEVIRQAIARGEKVLACAPSNTAVDNLLERLAKAGERVVRIGHPARVHADLQDHTLDALVEQDEAMRVIARMMHESERLFQKASRSSRKKRSRGDRQGAIREARQLQREARQYEQRVVDNVLRRADVICATTTTDPAVFGDLAFDLIVVDEACQSTEPGCWIPLLRGNRLVLAGDHCQLPPTVICPDASREGFTTSMMERLVDFHGDLTTRPLDVQYRMHEQIMQFSSQRFYAGRLIADGSVRAHRLADLEHVESTPLTDEPVTFIDTAGAGWAEELEPDGESKRNPQEGQLVLDKVAELRAAGLAAKDIAVIAPYAAQVRWLRDQSSESDLEIDTVDGFQGREKEAVVISLVRSNTIGEIGFLADTRRMNVALTRARRKLILIGDSSTLATHEFYLSLFEYLESIGAYRTVWEEDAVASG